MWSIFLLETPQFFPKHCSCYVPLIVSGCEQKTETADRMYFVNEQSNLEVGVHVT